MEISENTEKEVSLKEIRDTFYKCRDFEISNLWQRAIFLSAFLVLCFTMYGYLVSVLLKEVPDTECDNPDVDTCYICGDFNDFPV